MAGNISNDALLTEFCSLTGASPAEVRPLLYTPHHTLELLPILIPFDRPSSSSRRINGTSPPLLPNTIPLRKKAMREPRQVEMSPNRPNHTPDHAPSTADRLPKPSPRLAPAPAPELPARQSEEASQL